MSPKPPIQISIVVPVFNEEENLPELLRRLIATVRLMGKPTELIFVDDGSTDGTLDALKTCHSPVVDIQIVELARNFGQHAAVMAGFTQCRGDIIVTLDADLQNPPEEIPRLVAAMEQGHDVVGTIRKDRQDPYLRKLSSRLVNRVVAKATGHQLHDYGCMLRAYNRETVQSMLACPERRTFIPALAMTVARTATEIEVDHHSRLQGKSKYNLFSLLRLNLDLMMGFTSTPLRIVSVTGMIIAALGLLFSLYLIVRRLLLGPEVEGVFTLFAILYFFVGVQIMAVGLVAEYIARTYDEVRGRPRYLIRSVECKEGKES